MSRVTYNAGNMTITVAGIKDVERRLGKLKSKAPAAMKVAINATAREARKLMVAKAKARYAVNEKGRKHLDELKQKKKANNSSLLAELRIASMRSDLAYFKYSPTQVFTGQDVFTKAPSVVRGKVLKTSPMKPLPGQGNLSKGFLAEFASGHTGMVQRVKGSDGGNAISQKSGIQRWRTADGRIEKMQTLSAPSGMSMHNTIWPDVEPDAVQYLQDRLDQQIEKILAKANKE